MLALYWVSQTDIMIGYFFISGKIKINTLFEYGKATEYVTHWLADGLRRSLFKLVKKVSKKNIDAVFRCQLGQRFNLYSVKPAKYILEKTIIAFFFQSIIDCKSKPLLFVEFVPLSHSVTSFIIKYKKVIIYHKTFYLSNVPSVTLSFLHKPLIYNYFYSCYN